MPKRKLTKNERKEVIKLLLNESNGFWTKRDIPVLNSFSSRKLVGLTEQLAVTNQVLANQSDETNQEGDDDMSQNKLTPQQRKAIVDNLIANCDCSKGERANQDGLFVEEDRASLNALAEDRLLDLEQKRTKFLVG